MEKQKRVETLVGMIFEAMDAKIMYGGGKYETMLWKRVGEYAAELMREMAECADGKTDPSVQLDMLAGEVRKYLLANLLAKIDKHIGEAHKEQEEHEND